jgi:expansin (peptidoglycan-binding protein)
MAHLLCWVVGSSLVLTCASESENGGLGPDGASTGGTGQGTGGSWGSNAGASATGGAQTTRVTLGAQRSGEGTYYAATGEGACMFDASPNDLDIAALNASDWTGSALCGACADVQGPKGTLRIRIVDLCPECPSGNLDFSQQAFAKIAEISAGRVPITWSLVACDLSGPVQYRYKDGSNPWWTAVQVLNHRLPITTLEWSPDGNSWSSTERTTYNYFLATSGFGPNPVRVRITAVDGQTLVDSLPAVEPGQVATGQSQFR